MYAFAGYNTISFESFDVGS